VVCAALLAGTHERLLVISACSASVRTILSPVGGTLEMDTDDRESPE
jgi:hypothetical protein